MDIFEEGVKSEHITQESEVKLPVFGNQNKRQRLYGRMEDDSPVHSNGDCRPVEVAELCTQTSCSFSGRNRDMVCDSATTISGSDGTSDDESDANMADNPRMVRWFRFSVIDTGIGIAADKLDSLFEKFTQCSTSTTSTYGGTGLGLAVSKRLVSCPLASILPNSCKHIEIANDTCTESRNVTLCFELLSIYCLSEEYNLNVEGDHRARLISSTPSSLVFEYRIMYALGNTALRFHYKIEELSVDLAMHGFRWN